MMGRIMNVTYKELIARNPTERDAGLRSARFDELLSARSHALSEQHNARRDHDKTREGVEAVVVSRLDREIEGRFGDRVDSEFRAAAASNNALRAAVRTCEP